MDVIKTIELAKLVTPGYDVETGLFKVSEEYIAAFNNKPLTQVEQRVAIEEAMKNSGVTKIEDLDIFELAKIRGKTLNEMEEMWSDT
jgi:hypothetical protein